MEAAQPGHHLEPGPTLHRMRARTAAVLLGVGAAALLLCFPPSGSLLGFAASPLSFSRSIATPGVSSPWTAARVSMTAGGGAAESERLPPLGGVMRVVPFKAQRAPAASMMGGVENKMFSRGGARVALKVKGDAMSVETLANMCKEDGRAAGVIYCLPNGRMEVVAEGKESTLKELVDSITAVVALNGGGDEDLQAQWQLPLGSYEATFPIVDMTPETLSAVIELKGEEQMLDYMGRHVQIEAVFTRGLKVLKKERKDTRHLSLSVTGQTSRLKSFLRWCYRGAPMAPPPDAVTVQWS